MVNLRDFGLTLCSQAVCQMPADIQSRIEHNLDNAVEIKVKPLATTIGNDIKALSGAQVVASTGLIVRHVVQVGQETAAVVKTQTLECRAQNRRLQAKLDEMNASVQLLGLHFVHNAALDMVSETGLERAAQNIITNIWQLLSNLQRLIRELL
jgi:hypothetical protein